jgi:hypothetical protein
MINEDEIYPFYSNIMDALKRVKRVFRIFPKRESSKDHHHHHRGRDIMVENFKVDTRVRHLGQQKVNWTFRSIKLLFLA